MANINRNQLLASLSSNDFALLEPHLVPVTLGLRKHLERPNRRIEAAYFPERGFASVVAKQADGKEEIEVGLIGREGMTGAPIVLGNHRSPHAVYMQAAGEGKCIRATDLRTAIQTSRSLQSQLLKFVQAFVVQTAQTAICNARLNLEQRLARWLLMAHDRLDGDRLPLTHEFLSLMLGVRRATVTEALAELESQELIHCQRGQVTVQNRKCLE